MSLAAGLLAFLAALGPGSTEVVNESAGVRPRLLDPESLPVEEVARNSVEWLKAPHAGAEDFFRVSPPLRQPHVGLDFSSARGEGSTPIKGKRAPASGAIDYYRSGFVASPQLPNGHFELDTNSTGLSFTFEDARPGSVQAPAALASGPNMFLPSRYPPSLPYAGKPTGHFDLTYNSTGLNFTLAEDKPNSTFSPPPSSESTPAKGSATTASTSTTHKTTVPSQSSTSPPTTLGPVAHSTVTVTTSSHEPSNEEE